MPAPLPNADTAAGAGWPNAGWPNTEPELAGAAFPALSRAEPNVVGCVFPNAEKPPLLAVFPDPEAEELLFTAAAAAANGDDVLPAKALNAPVAGLIKDDCPNEDWPKAEVVAAAGDAVWPNADCPNAGWPKADVVVVLAAGAVEV